MAKSNLLLKLRRLVDRDQATRLRPVTPLLGALPLALSAVLQPHLSEAAATAAWIIAAAIGGAWTAFAWWRGYRLFRASSLRSDRRFDTHGKFDLAPEYHRTESATKARQKRRIDREWKR